MRYNGGLPVKRAASDAAFLCGSRMAVIPVETVAQGLVYFSQGVSRA